MRSVSVSRLEMNSSMKPMESCVDEDVRLCLDWEAWMDCGRKEGRDADMDVRDGGRM